MATTGGRWPPVYDAEELARTIDQLATRIDASAGFFASLSRGGALCQGDVLSFSSPLPVIDESGEVSVSEAYEHWLVIGNTCDFDRSVDEVAYTQVVPLYLLPPDTPAALLNDLRRYALSRKFHVPAWPGAPSRAGLVADFLKPVALHKSIIGTKAHVLARMSREGWILLHSALVRFLARDDGRFDE